MSPACRKHFKMLLLHRIKMVVVAQLVRAMDCGSIGRGFEPRLPPQKTFGNSRRFFCFLIFVNHKPTTDESHTKKLDSPFCHQFLGSP